MTVMNALDRLIPAPQLLESEHVDVAEAPAVPFSLRVDDLVSAPERPGFQILVDDPPREVAVGRSGKSGRARSRSST